MIGKKIRSLRRDRKMTQEQLAEILSVSYQAVSKWENELSSPDTELLPVIAGCFGVTMDELFDFRLDKLNYKEQFVQFMIENDVLRFGNFQLNSGRISPYFIDTGNYKSGSLLMKLGEFYADCIAPLCSGMGKREIEQNVLFGSSNNGIPLSIATSMMLYQKYGLNIDYCFERKKNASGSCFVGRKLNGDEKVMIVEDILTSGNTLRGIIQKLQSDWQVHVSSVIISVDRKEKGKYTSAFLELEKEFGIKIVSIVTFEDIIRTIEKNMTAGAEYLDELKQYREEFGGE